jgi:hypothetical protein
MPYRYEYQRMGLRRHANPNHSRDRMNPLRPKDWEKSAFRAAVSGLVFGGVLVLLDKGFNWLISAKTSGQDDFFFIVGLALVMYFNAAIDSIHDRLNEIERAVGK